MTTLPRALGFLDGVALVVGTIVGSGIFASPGSVLRHCGSGAAALIVWFSAGMMAYCGALCYAELAISIPSAGGEVAYLKRSYGELASYLFVWTNVWVTRPAALGIICIVFGEYLCRFTSEVCQDAVTTRFLSVMCACAVTALNAWSASAATKALGFSTVSKVTALVLIAIIGLVYVVAAATGRPLHERTSDKISASLSFQNTSQFWVDYPQAFMACLWAYDGWNNLNYASEEMVNPKQDLIRATKWSVPVVTFLYVCANAAYIAALPKEVAQSSETVGVDLAFSTMGRVGQVIMLLFVLISAFGAAVGTLFSSSRLAYSAARNGLLHHSLAHLNEHRKTPTRALALQLCLTCGYMSIGNFDGLVGIFGSATWFFYALTVMGMLKLRKTEPDLERPYRAPLLAALAFCTTASVLVVIGFLAKPTSGGIAFGFILLGVPMFYLTKRYAPSTSDAVNDDGVEIVFATPRSHNEEVVELLRSTLDEKALGIDTNEKSDFVTLEKV